MTQFLDDNIHIMSGSDDKTVRIWDIPSESELIRYREHEVCGLLKHIMGEM